MNQLTDDERHLYEVMVREKETAAINCGVAMQVHGLRLAMTPEQVRRVQHNFAVQYYAKKDDN